MVRLLNRPKTKMLFCFRLFQNIARDSFHLLRKISRVLSLSLCQSFACFSRTTSRSTKTVLFATPSKPNNPETFRVSSVGHQNDMEVLNLNFEHYLSATRAVASTRLQSYQAFICTRSLRWLSIEPDSPAPARRPTQALPRPRPPAESSKMRTSNTLYLTKW